jgi:hypothetical protein
MKVNCSWHWIVLPLQTEGPNLAGNLITSREKRLTLRQPLESEKWRVKWAWLIKLISIESIDYCILCNDKADIQSCNKSSAILLPRNRVIFKEAQFTTPALLTLALNGAVNTLLIHYSLHPIRSFYHNETRKLEYLVFESGTELHSIPPSAFSHFRLKSLFVPPTVSVVSPKAFAGCSSVACVHFSHKSCLSFTPYCRIQITL